MCLGSQVSVDVIGRGWLELVQGDSSCTPEEGMAPTFVLFLDALIIFLF